MEDVAAPAAKRQRTTKQDRKTTQDIRNVRAPRIRRVVNRAVFVTRFFHGALGSDATNECSSNNYRLCAQLIAQHAPGCNTCRPLENITEAETNTLRTALQVFAASKEKLSQPTQFGCNNAGSYKNVVLNAIHAIFYTSQGAGLKEWRYVSDSQTPPKLTPPKFNSL
jgi:hypothetical protein